MSLHAARVVSSKWKAWESNLTGDVNNMLLAKKNCVS